MFDRVIALVGRSGDGRVEVGFVVAVVGMVVVSLLAPFVVAAPTDEADGSAFDPDIDRAGEPPSVADEPAATVGDRTFERAQDAIDAADPGDTVVLEGRFDERLVVNTSDVRVVAGDGGAVIDAGGDDRIVTVGAENVTLEGLWLRDSGDDLDNEDAGVFVDGNGTVLDGLYLTEVTYGIWVDGVDDVVIRDSRVEGKADVQRETDRGNGIHLWRTEGTAIEDTEITGVRDGIYFSWSSDVLAANNTIWDVRYGVHYMYSDDNRLVDNVAVDNDVGYALMVSKGLEVTNNTAVRNEGQSGHGILVKDIEDSEIAGNVLVENANGLFVYNAQNNEIVDNLVLRNGVGIHHTAGSEDQFVAGNSFIDNAEAVVTTTSGVEVWNGTERGNYWSDARTVDLDNDGTSEVRYRPAGLVEHLVGEHPQAAVFAESPAFDAVRLAESSFPVVESPGIVDQHPLVEPPHDDWRTYANNRD